MTDKELTPEQAEAVRRLLAEARHEQPMPEVVSRHLDDVIAGLAADRAAADGPGTGDRVVVPLHRRRWPRVLVAAASVCAIGLGIGQVVGAPGGGDSDSGGDSTGALLDSPAQEGEASVDEGRSGSLSPPASGPGDGDDLLDDRDRAAFKAAKRYLNLDAVSTTALNELAHQLERADRGPLQPLGRQHLTSALIRLQNALDLEGVEELAATLGNRGVATYDARIAPQACGPLYTVVGGQATYATYRDRLALVIFHPKVHGTQLVELYVCSGKTPRRSVERVTLWDGE